MSQNNPQPAGGTMGSTVPNGNPSRHYLGINYPSSLSQFADALCADGDSREGVEAFKNFSRDSLRTMPEFSSAFWNNPGAYGRVLFAEFYALVTTGDPETLRKLNMPSHDFRPAPTTALWLYARLAFVLNRMLVDNSCLRVLRYPNAPFSRRAEYLSALPAYRGSYRAPNDRYWRLVFQIIHYTRQELTGRDWLQRQAAENRFIAENVAVYDSLP